MSTLLLSLKETLKYYFISYNNIASYGGTMYIDGHSNITYKGNSTVTFDDNEAGLGGSMYIAIANHSNIIKYGST